MHSGLRGTVRWRGRARAQFDAWSVLPVIAVVVLCGGLFWASVWIVLRPSASTSTGESTELADVAGSAADALDGTSEAVVAAASEPSKGPAILDVQATTDSAAELADTEAADTEIADTGAADTADAEVANAEVAEVTAGPVYGPAIPAGFVEASGSPEAVASADASEEQVEDSGEPVAEQAEVLTARAEEATARAEALTARAEEVTARIEGLTARIEELETKLEASGAALAALPALAPSPVPAPPPSETVARGGQAQSGTRPPWVVLPQPEPGSRVTAGPLVLEARARGEAPITQIRLQLDGVALPVTLEQRDDRTWRGRAATRVNPGQHTVAVTVVDGEGRTGSYRWQFNAGS